MVRFVCFVLAFFTVALFSVHGASIGKRTKRETCGVMMLRTNNCSNHGYCRTDNIGPHCMCYEGWGGHLCQDVVNRPQGENSPLVDDGGSNEGDDSGDADDDDAQVTEDTRRPEVTTQVMHVETTVDQDDDEDDDEMMRTERPTQDGGVIGGDGGEGDRVAFLCDELYAGTDSCSNRQGHCSVDGIGAFCQCNIGFIGVACQYRAENVAQVLQALIGMMRDPHYRVIGGSSP